MSAQLACQADVARVATTDRVSTAEQLIDVAVKDAIRLVRVGRVGAAEYRLTRAGRAASRILGPTESVLPEGQR